jgi:hypothetical protein
VDFVASVIAGATNYRRCSHCRDNLSLVSLLPATINCRCHGIDENPEQGLTTDVNDTGDNISPVSQIIGGVVDTSDKHKLRIFEIAPI